MTFQSAFDDWKNYRDGMKSEKFWLELKKGHSFLKSRLFTSFSG
jgi:hypothetical protein